MVNAREAAMGGELKGWKLVPVDPTPEMIGAAGLAMFKSDLATAMDPRAGFIASWAAAVSASPAPPSGAAWGVLDIDTIVAVAEIEWSYHEDDNKYPRDFWHARIAFGPFSTDWVSFGEQEQRDLPPDEKAAAEADLRETIRHMALSLPTRESALTPAPSYAEGVEAAAKVAERMYVTDAFRFEFGNDVAAAIRALAGKPPAEGRYMVPGKYLGNGTWEAVPVDEAPVPPNVKGGRT